MATKFAQGELNHKINRKIAVDCFPIRHRLSGKVREREKDRRAGGKESEHFPYHFTKNQRKEKKLG